VSWVRDSKVGWILRAVGLCKTRPLALRGDGAVPRVPADELYAETIGRSRMAV